MTRGFTVIELLVAMGLTLALAAAIAQLARPAHQAFDRLPNALDIEQRGRTALDVMAQAARAGGANVSLADPDDSGAFASMTAIAPVASAAQGKLESSQTTPNGAITLAVAPCPNVKDVCGFTSGAAALIADGMGSADVFIVGSVNPGARRLTPNRALSRAYPAGSPVIEVDQSTFSLALQTDGSYTLVRETAAGAIQPVADFIDALTFSIQQRRLDIVLTIGDREYRTSVHVRNGHE